MAKYEKWLEPDNLILLEGWARDGLTDDDISAKIGINRTTLYDWKNKYPDLSNALKKGKEVVDYEVENALCKKAKSGDVMACIYWLNNRKPERWRNKRENENTNNADNLQSLRAIFEGVKNGD